MANFDHIGKKIRFERRAKELSLKDLAKTVGCSFQMIHKIEKGEGFNSKFIEKILKALGIEERRIKNIPFDHQDRRNSNSGPGQI